MNLEFGDKAALLIALLLAMAQIVSDKGVGLLTVPPAMRGNFTVSVVTCTFLKNKSLHFCLWFT